MTGNMCTQNIHPVAGASPRRRGPMPTGLFTGFLLSIPTVGRLARVITIRAHMIRSRVRFTSSSPVPRESIEDVVTLLVDDGPGRLHAETLEALGLFERVARPARRKEDHQ